MQDLLYLVHRIPYPPDKGDKIRSYHLFRHLAARYRVHLGAFVDDPEDRRHADALRGLCASLRLIDIGPAVARWKSLRGLLTGEALTTVYYRHPAMRAWVDERLAAGVGQVVCYSSAMAQFVMAARGARRIMDFVDMDSDKWRQYAPTKPWPLSWLYRREADRLLDWEARVAGEFDAGLFVSAQEAADFRAAAPAVADRVGWYGNGVDADYFSPEREYDNPYAPGVEAVVFTGAMDYWPNVDAVSWFAREVFPAVRAARPRAEFCIVGSRPSSEVQALARLPGVRVTGRVPDVRPYLAHALAVVAPLRIARGVQNKVLEGMAMARSVVVSPQALEGLSATPGTEVLLAEGAEQYAARTLEALAGLDLGAAARQRVLTEYAWEACLARVDELLQGGSTT
ncbi:MAG: TIGR03087 family PEP-CTERM/XrtA system glycosyltransferase [Thiobacillaceae bacterium]|jgi:sugar transferase (PEP-CTERM/EpsH1 system associated)|nr:TIGR03087 family PEP-CTERM/XrtA system glycosyltransferase [Thiobacillaceae bacterium]